MEFFTTIFLLFLSYYPILHLLKFLSRLKRVDDSCYLLDYQCYKPPEDRKLDADSSLKVVFRNENLGPDEHEFLLRTIVSSGISEETYGPQNIIAGKEKKPLLQDSIQEMDEIFFETLDKIFLRSSILPQEIDILVVNVSLFTPIPSLTSRIVNHYKMKPDIKTFNLSGMGCSANLVSIDLVKNLFKVHKRTLAIVVSTESVGPNWYCGKDRSMMLTNCIFRSGGCSLLLTNNPDMKHKAMMKLNHLVRTHIGSNDEAYECCIDGEDSEGYKGFRLTRQLPKASSMALVMNLQVLLHKILPVWDIVCYYGRVFVTLGKEKRLLLQAVGQGFKMKIGVKHFCVHPGGKAVIDKVGNSLGLSNYDLDPAQMTFQRFANTSSAGLWYVLGYMEANKRLKKRDRILMIGFGAGFKCNTCVWEVMRDMDSGNVWEDCINWSPPRINPFTLKYGWIILR